ncbi:MAG: methyltransferase domain-containing protein [Polaromonas sp.]|nr:methyltransferase domain-containing protein [Polaromonas sp.]
MNSRINQENIIETTPCPTCRICQLPGLSLHQGLRDRLFGVPGEWNLKKCGNPKCGLIWLDPMPVSEDLGRLYETYYTHEIRENNSLAKGLYRRAIDAYLSKRFGYPARAERNAFDDLLGALLYLHPGARAEADARVMELPVHPGGRLLEVGFGNAKTLARMQTLGWDVQGVEFDPVAVNNAAASGLVVHLGDIAAQNFADESFDAVVSSHVLEHLPDPEGFLRECWRVLKPGGIVLAYTPNSRSLGHLVFGPNWRGLEPPRHLHLFNSDNLIGMARAVGLSDISYRVTVRGGVILAASWYLSRMSKSQNLLTKKGSRILEEVAHYLSWAACKFNGNLGEELVLTARKPETAT